MAIDLNVEYDARTIRRISNLEERIRDILTTNSQFVTASQVQEIITVYSTEIAALNSTIVSLEKRVSILEDIPDVI
tara:strand:+ start:1051 stop:1278 length:228 start_codon:yes stop_codon:yes gene_type:complete